MWGGRIKVGRLHLFVGSSPKWGMAQPNSTGQNGLNSRGMRSIPCRPTLHTTAASAVLLNMVHLPQIAPLAFVRCFGAADKR